VKQHHADGCDHPARLKAFQALRRPLSGPMHITRTTHNIKPDNIIAKKGGCLSQDRPSALKYVNL
jgi:hypothetical protein